METNDLITAVISGVNTVIVIGTFIITLIVNGKSTLTQNKVEAISSVLNNELEIKKETSILAMQKAIDAFEHIDTLIEKMKRIDDSTFDEINKLIKIESYQFYWKNIIYYPQDLGNSLMNILRTAINAINNYKADESKFWKEMNTINEEYFNYIKLFRTRYYFDSINLGEIMDSRFKEIV